MDLSRRSSAGPLFRGPCGRRSESRDVWRARVAGLTPVQPRRVRRMSGQTPALWAQLPVETGNRGWSASAGELGRGIAADSGTGRHHLALRAPLRFDQEGRSLRCPARARKGRRPRQPCFERGLRQRAGVSGLGKRRVRTLRWRTLPCAVIGLCSTVGESRPGAGWEQQNGAVVCPGIGLGTLAKAAAKCGSYRA